MKIKPDPDFRTRCRHRSGDPDCDCWPECPECGAGYDPREGHDCVDCIDELPDAIEQAKRFRDEAEGLREELAVSRTELEKAKAGWKALAEAPHTHRGMKVSLRGFIGRVSEYLDRKDQGGDAFQLREIQRHLCEVWRRRGEPGIVAEFGALYCLDKDGPIEEPEDDDEDGDATTEGAQA